MPEKLKVMIELEVEFDEEWDSITDANNAKDRTEKRLEYMLDSRDFEVMDVTATPDISDHEEEWAAQEAMNKRVEESELRKTKGEVG